MPSFRERIKARAFNSASSRGVEIGVSGDTESRFVIEAGGKHQWGDGTTNNTFDVNLYRSAADQLQTDDVFVSSSGIVTLTTTGEPTASLPDGAIAIDTTNNILYIRSGGAWVESSGGASVTVSDTPPLDPEEGDLWFESDTGDIYVYYSSTWVDIGGSSVANIAVTTTPPSSPVNGDLWFDTDTAKTYVYYNDGTSGQWVEIGAASAAASGTDGAIQFASGGTFSSDATNFVWDDANNRLGVGISSPTDTLDVNGTLNVRDHIDFSDTTPDAANRVAIYPHGYDLYVDNAGAGADNTRLWLNGPDEGEVVIGPRSGSSTLGNMRIRSDDISLEGNVNITGSLTGGGLITGETYYFTDNSQYAPEYGSNYYRTALYTISAPSGKSISSVQLTVRSSAPAWVTITAQSSSSYSYYVWSKGASTGYVNYLLDCR